MVMELSIIQMERVSRENSSKMNRYAAQAQTMPFPSGVAGKAVVIRGSPWQENPLSMTLGFGSVMGRTKDADTRGPGLSTKLWGGKFDVSPGDNFRKWKL